VGSEHIFVSLSGRDSLARDLTALQQTDPVRVEAPILARVAAVSEADESGFLSTLVTAAVLIGRVPTSVRDLANVMKLSPRRLRERLHELQGPDASALLRWTFVLHCLGQAQLCNKPLKCIATEAGYKRPETLTNRMARLRGRRLRETLQRGGFRSVLDEFADWLALYATQNSAGQFTATTN
jgi:hypothetical protein